jgi:hypothetical protein
MSAGKSFHSVSGRAFWKDREEVDEEGVADGRRGGGPADEEPLKGGRFTAAAIVPPLTSGDLAGAPAVGAEDVGHALCHWVGAKGGGAGAPGPTSRRTIHAVSGRSLK